MAKARKSKPYKQTVEVGLLASGILIYERLLSMSVCNSLIVKISYQFPSFHIYYIFRFYKSIFLAHKKKHDNSLFRALFLFPFY